MNKLLIVLLLFLAACSDEFPQNGPINNNNERKFLLEFIDGKKMGLDFKHEADFSELFSIYEPLGSGLAIIDYDNDNDMDVFVAQYGSKGNSSKLFENNQMQFTDVTEKSGLGKLNGLIFASVADANNDGFADLLIGGKNNLSLWFNQGDGTFQKSDFIKPLKGKQFYTSASWFDINRDGYLDLWVTNYVDDSIPAQCRLPNGNLHYCQPKSYRYIPDLMFLNQQGQAFIKQKVSQEIANTSPGLGVVSDDFDNNGWVDIYVANDGVANQLFYNFDGVLSADQAKESGVAFNLMGASEASMGIAIGDIDNNNFSDLYVTHFKGETNTLYMNNKGLFTDKTAQSKLVQHVRPVTGFGALLVDFNGDNLLDIITVNGSIQHDKSQKIMNQLVAEPVQFWKNAGSLNFAFEPNTNNGFEQRVGRGLVSVDLDNDGDTDFIVTNNNQNMSIIQNHSNPSNWIGITAVCQNRMDNGAKIKLESNYSGIKSLYRTVHSDGSYASSIDARIIINNADQFDKITIKWTASQTIEVYQIDELNVSAYNQLNCKL